jgi:transposase
MFKENEAVQAITIGVNGRRYIRQQEVIDFDNKVKDLIKNNPKIPYREIASQLNVKPSSIANSVHRLQHSNELSIKRNNFTQQNGKRAERRAILESEIWKYIDNHKHFSPGIICSYLLNSSNIKTSHDLVIKILKEIGKYEYIKPENKKQNVLVNPIQKPVQANFEIYELEDDKNNDDTESYPEVEFKNTERYFEVRKKLIRDLYLNDTPKDEIKELTLIDDMTLKTILKDLRKSGELPLPSRPNPS